MKGDLIDRAALSTVRIEIPKKLDDETCRIIEGILKAFKSVIDSAPAVDAVEVVRCKECAHWVTNAGHQWCEMREGVMKDPDFFCADGERKVQE